MAHVYAEKEQKTIEAIHQIVITCSKQYCEQGVLTCTAQSVKEQLYISRSLASLYLNHLTKEGKIIKIISRPVYFLDRQTIETGLSMRFSKTVFEDVDEFSALLRDQNGKKNDFLKLIGHSTSLKYCVHQCVMAINYPPNGLPLLLCGQKGSGRQLMARCMYEYALSNHIIDANASFFSISCQKGEHSKKMIQDSLKEQEGFVYISEIECLKKEDQSALIAILHHCQIEARKDKASCRFVLSTTHPLESIDKELLDVIPVQVQIPDLESRFLSDKRDLLLHFLKKEEQQLQCRLYLNPLSFGALLKYHYEENIDQLKSVVRWTCANAAADRNDSGIVTIKPLDLPASIVRTLSVKNMMEEKEAGVYFPLAHFYEERTEAKANAYAQALFDDYAAYVRGAMRFDEFLYRASNETNSYFDYHIYKIRYQSEELKTLETMVSHIVRQIAETYQIYLSANFSIVLSRILYMLMMSDQSAESRQDKERAKEIYTLFDRRLEKEMMIAKELRQTIKSLLDLSIDDVNMLFICIYISFYNKKIDTSRITGVILSHGYSTASSITDAVNRMLGKHVFEAIDMPLDTSVESIVSPLRKFVQQKSAQQVLLLVDMGSLEDIGSSLSEIANLNIGVLNNISTKVALSAGMKILQNQDLRTILKEVCEESQISYQLIKSNRKRKAIVFSAENGIEATKRVIDLFVKSLPDKMDLDFLYFAYEDLDHSAQCEVLLQEHEVLLLIGSLNPMLEGIPFIALEDIIANENISLVNSILSEYLDSAGIKQFNKNLVKNFALLNIIGYLTILNPEKLLNAVESSIYKLQQHLQLTFSNRLIIGLNMHISCLIERLVTNTEKEKEKVEQTAKFMAFVQVFQESFDELQQLYKVVIPDHEIGYVYRYIQEELTI